MEKYFHIESVDRERLLVIILSCEMTSVYWKELNETLKNMQYDADKVYFDFLFRNGYENRFFMANLDDNSNIKGLLKKCDGFDVFKKISHRYFSLHEELLTSSILSSQQIDQYLQEY